MVIGLCGFGFTGSGAVLDLLKEYDGLTIGKEYEMSFLYRPDGITDLRYHLENPMRFFSSDYAMKRFENKIHKFFRTHPEAWGLKSFHSIYELTENYLDSLTDVKWRGWWNDDADYFEGLAYFLYRVLIKITSYNTALSKKMQRYFYYRDMRISVCPRDFIEVTREYLANLFLIIGYDIEKNNVVLDQPFSGDNPSASSIYFRNPKTIVVDKDPRDLYLLLKKESFMFCSWTPTDNVHNFIKYYDSIRRKYTGINEKKELLIKVEDLIYEYDVTVKKIENYLELDRNQHKREFQFFDPQKSINNTQLFRKYPEYEADIKEIERLLPEYLFDFSKYPEMIKFGITF